MLRNFQEIRGVDAMKPSEFSRIMNKIEHYEAMISEHNQHLSNPRTLEVPDVLRRLFPVIPKARL